ncbi:MAG: CDP-alcohol phosphatidyltransferase family protein [Methanobacteriota archaeon]|nr:MAG: CDP-alcohol phosphatidyltransferase family protein [Euryarchaeota archaeon]
MTEKKREPRLGWWSLGFGFEGLWRRLRPCLEVLASPLSKTGVTPNKLTILGFISALSALYWLSNQRWVLAALFILLSGLFDALDGAIARLTGLASHGGGFFDSTMDRYGEVAILLGYLLAYPQPKLWWVLTCYAAILGSLMVSYTRARAESLGLDCRVGVGTRVERLLVLSAFNLASPICPGCPSYGLIIVAAISNFTAFQRLVFCYKKLAEKP